MIKPEPPAKHGIAAMLLLFCAAALIAGVALDVLTPQSGPRFGVITQPGGRAVLGVGVVAALVLAAQAMRMLLSVHEDGGGDAGDNA